MMSKSFQDILRAFNAHKIKYWLLEATPSACNWSRVAQRISTSGLAQTWTTQKLCFKHWLSSALR